MVAGNRRAVPCDGGGRSSPTGGGSRRRREARDESRLPDLRHLRHLPGVCSPPAWRCPSRSRFPAVLYLLLQGGVGALNGLGLVSWGSMNSFTLTAVAALHADGRAAPHQRPQRSHLQRPCQAGSTDPRRPSSRPISRGCAIFASVSGSSIATAASIGSVAPAAAGPAQNNGALASRPARWPPAAPSAFSFPPSFGMIVYGTFTDTSVAQALHGRRRAGLDDDRHLHDLHRDLREIPRRRPCRPKRGVNSFGELVAAFVRGGCPSPSSSAAPSAASISAS